MDYVARAREAARRWRETQPGDLISVSSFVSSLQSRETDPVGDQRTLAREMSTKETKETKEESSSRLSLEYRLALHTVWGLMAAGEYADPQACHQALAEVRRLTDELGVLTALHLRHSLEQEWTRERGQCPRCGGAPHEDGA